MDGAVLRGVGLRGVRRDFRRVLRRAFVSRLMRGTSISVCASLAGHYFGLKLTFKDYHSASSFMSSSTKRLCYSNAVSCSPK